MSGTAGQVERRGGGQDRILTNKLVTILSGHGGEPMTADTVNLGPGGMFVATESPFAVGDRFICRLELGGAYKPVLSGAEVCWRSLKGEHPGMGVRFLDIAEAASSLSGELPTAGPETVRVRLDSVGTALDASVTGRDGQELVIDMELPFLRSGALVDVGPDVAARTAAIRSIEWLGEGQERARMRIHLDLEPTAASAAAGQVVDEQRAPVAIKAEAPAPEPEPEAEKPWHRKKKVKRKSKPQSNWARRAKLLNWSREEPEEAEAVEAEPLDSSPPDDAVILGGPDPEEEAFAAEQERGAAQERREPQLVVEGDLEEEPEEEPLEAEARATEDQPRAREPKIVSAEAASESCEEEEEREEGAEEGAEGEAIDASSFSPLGGALERVLGAALTLRVMATLGRLKALVASKINGPKLAAAGRFCLDVLSRGFAWTRANLGQGASKLLAAIRDSKLIQKRRRQSVGEPSRVVRSLTDRARKVAAGRGRKAAVIVLVTLGLAGLGAVGYGLLGSANAEAETEQLQREASRAGWSSDRWQEPEPVETPNPS